MHHILEGIYYNTKYKRPKMQVTIVCFYGGLIFFSLSTSSFISIFPSLIYLFIPIFIFCPIYFLLNMFCHNGVVVLYLEPWGQNEKKLYFLWNYKPTKCMCMVFSKGQVQYYGKDKIKTIMMDHVTLFNLIPSLCLCFVKVKKYLTSYL